MRGVRVRGYASGTMIKRPKIAIVGAGGNVGAAVSQWAVQKELGELVLIDIKAGPAEKPIGTYRVSETGGEVRLTLPADKTA